MTYKGHIDNGVVVLDEPLDLPDGARVIVSCEVLETAGIHPEVKRMSGILPPETDVRSEYAAGLEAKHR